jgi:hypothetical protein
LLRDLHGASVVTVRAPGKAIMSRKPSARKKPCCCDMKALRDEIERRAQGRADAARNMLLAAGAGRWSHLSTSDLVGRLRDLQRAVYGTDGRKDIYAVTRPELREVADSVVALVAASDLERRGNGRFTLSTTRYADDYNLCAGEPFFDQPLGCDCTGFLVAPDVIATAGHCARSMRRVRSVRFVFGFRMLDARKARTQFAAADVYEGAAIIGREESDDTGADWALVRLARPVVGRTPLRVRASGKIADGRPVFVVGHPNGLPVKLADGARVRSNRRRAFFVANLDTYGGNSGSPVLDLRTRTVEGILVNGEDDFVEQGDCRVSMVCPDAGCRGEAVTRATVFAKHIPR